MITPALNKDGFTGHILIEPNRPIGWNDNLRFIKYFAFVSLMIGATAMYHGFLLVMPFSGIEIIFVSMSLYLVYKHYSICQVIYFTANHIVIESGRNCADTQIKYQRHWSKFHVDHKTRNNIPRLCINSKGHSTVIGAFLSYDDMQTLISLLKTITRNFQSQ